MTFKVYALQYASWGLAVFPLKPRDKTPLTNNGSKDATKNTDQISEWWDRWPNANIAIATGAASNGLFVIDLDVNEEKGINGYEVLSAWEKVNGSLPDTVQSITGRGGYDLYYNDQSTVRNAVGIYDGVDIRGEGGYVVAPPSIHPNGREYAWENDLSETTIAAATGIVFDFILPKKENKRHETQPLPQAITEGSRTSTLVSTIASMRGKSFPVSAIEAAVRATNEQNCFPPLSDKELEREVLLAIQNLNPGDLKHSVFSEAASIHELIPITASQLENLDIPPIQWIVKGMLSIGLSMISAPPKYFKSYMVLGLCVCVCVCDGLPFLGFETVKSGCLYLDLESTKRRPKERLKQILGDQPAPSNLFLLTSEDGVKPLEDGFEIQLQNILAAHPEIKFIAIDVFQMIRKEAKRTQTGYDRDYADLIKLKQIADRFSVSIMVVHHNRKMKDNDPFNMISGSAGTLGSLDCAWIITKDSRLADEGVLHVTGRDIESRDLKVAFNKETYQWEFQGDAELLYLQHLQFEFEQSPITETIHKLLENNNGRWEGSIQEIIGFSGFLEGWSINDDTKTVGKFLTNHKDDFELEGIRVEKKRRGSKRVYVVTNVTDVTDVMVV